MSMRITCDGSRGSIPIDGEEFALLGRGTSSYFIECDEIKIIMDHGSGIVGLAKRIMAKGPAGFTNQTYTVCQSHWHDDHLIGLPFFTPYYIASNEVTFIGPIPPGMENTKDIIERILSEQQAPPFFPVAHVMMPCSKNYRDVSPQGVKKFVIYPPSGQYGRQATIPYSPGMPYNPDTDVMITAYGVNHPTNGCLGYAIEYQGKKVVYHTDDEPLRYPCVKAIANGMNADLLIGDCQYTEAQLAGSTQTWGHGSIMSIVELATAMKAKRVWLHHFDPSASDEEMLARLREVFLSTSNIEAGVKPLSVRDEMAFDADWQHLGNNILFYCAYPKLQLEL